MKKTIALILCLVFLATIFSSCQNDNDPLKDKYKYDLSQYIDLAEYKGLPAEAIEYNVDERDYIDKVVLSTRYYYAREVAVDKAAENNDIVYFSSTGTIDGVAFEGATATNKATRLGTGQAGEAFEKNLIGLKAGDTKTFSVSVPDNENEEEELRGKTVTYTVYIIKVCESELPEYTDNFVKLYLNYDSIEEYENSILESLKAQYQDTLYKTVIPTVWENVVKNTTVKKYPEAEVKNEYDSYINGINDYCESYGITLGQFARANFDKNEEEFLVYAQEEAEKKVKEDMIVFAIARAENITISEEEYTDRATNYAKNVYELSSLSELEEKFSKDEIYRAILIDMVQEFVADNAEITFVSAIEKSETESSTTE